MTEPASPTTIVLPSGICVEEYTTRNGVTKCAVQAPRHHMPALTRALTPLGATVRAYTSRSGDRCGASGITCDVLDVLAAVEPVA